MGYHHFDLNHQQKIKKKQLNAILPEFHWIQLNENWSSVIGKRNKMVRNCEFGILKHKNNGHPSLFSVVRSHRYQPKHTIVDLQNQ